MADRVETKVALSIAAACVCLAAVAERHPIERYQSIIDRQMFGQPPPNFDPTKPPSQVQKGAGDEKELTREQEVVKSSIHFSAINVTPAGDVAVGFTDNSDSKLPIHYYLKVGEERNGWKVLEADPVKAKMKIAKGDIEVELDLGANSARGGGSTARAGVNAAPAVASANRRMGLLGGMRRPSSDGEQPKPGMMGASLRERRAAREQARQEEAAKEKELEAKREQERAAREKAEKEEKAQREAEREEQRRELQLLKDELKAQREAAERARAERESVRQDENAEDEN